MIQVPEDEDLEDLKLAFKKDQTLLKKLLVNCRGQGEDSKFSMR
jgi:hypothetical protein